MNLNLDENTIENHKRKINVSFDFPIHLVEIEKAIKYNHLIHPSDERNCRPAVVGKIAWMIVNDNN